MSIDQHIIRDTATIKEAMSLLNTLGVDAIIFVVDENKKLLGSLTDGDIRRGLLNNNSIEDNVLNFVQANPKYINKNSFDIKDVIEYRNRNFKIIPVVDEEKKIVQIVNFRLSKSYLPVDAVLMAGGKGERLRPLTDNTPKPLLKVGPKSIIEHNIDNLMKYGIDDFHITLRFLGQQIEDKLGDGSSKNITIDYVYEKDALGTAGSLKNVTTLKNEYILLSNSDVLTTLDYEDFFLDFINNDADLSVFTIPYTVNVPLGVFEIDKKNKITDIKEKPTYTYFSNSGIYLMKKNIVDHIPNNAFYNATDLVEDLIKKGLKVISYNSAEYWLDIGTPNDFEKAQRDILHIKF